MNLWKRTTITLGFAALLAGAPVFGATLKGTVRTADGEPIAASVSVLYSSQGASMAVHHTGEDGTFSIEIGSGAVAAAASAADYSSDEIDLSGGVPGSASFTLHPLRYFRGTLRDASGNGVTGAFIRVRNLDSDRSIHVDSYSTDVSDGDGSFTIAIPDGGSDRFVADIEADGWVPQSSGVLGASSRALGAGAVGRTGVEDGSGDSVLIELESRGASASGRVTSPSGSALEGVRILAAVRVRQANTGALGGSGVQAGPGESAARPPGNVYRVRSLTNSDGRYDLSGLPSGSLAVVAIKRGVRIPVQRFVSSEGGSYTADFVIPD